MVAQADSVPALENLITIPYAAENLGVTPKTVRRWIAEGQLTAYRIGPRFIRLDRAEISAMFRRVPTTDGGAA